VASLISFGIARGVVNLSGALVLTLMFFRYSKLGVKWNLDISH
jgi:hypothetical protein